PILDESARLYGLASAEQFGGQQPIERLLEPEEVAAALVFLAGEHAGGITGTALPVDGGLSI
ncbi:MAG TPA: SDR family oxidoreductase, partial [Solirubrobacteraceae bacterium]|nr:SDR family oxidoreductase [Solirubrobacteraceae bacterium]